MNTGSEMQVSDGSGKEPNGKQALTRFQRICTDGTYSIVLCKPVTGRTHQVYLLMSFVHCTAFSMQVVRSFLLCNYLLFGLDHCKLVDVHGMRCSHISDFMVKSIPCLNC